MSGLTINQKVIAWAKGQLGKQVGRGECWDLADQALRKSGAHSSDSTEPDADYDWGEDIRLGDAGPGDVLQFRDYSVTTTTTTTMTFTDGTETTETDEETMERPHHTALVDTNPGNGWINVLEQNAPPKGRKVQKYKMATRSMDIPPKTVHKSVKNPVTKKIAPATIVTEVSIVVSGTISAYRPEAPSQ
jgi:hypothetical protein